MDRADILAWLRETDEERLETLWRAADAVRRENVGDEVHLRGLIEISNVCVRQCAYCGLRRGNAQLQRYRMTEAEILACVGQAVGFGYGTVVLQSGEDPGIGRAWMADLIRRIKAETPLAVTLSLGERSDEELAAWREAGADRYLLRFETSNPDLYARIHPPLGSRVSQAPFGPEEMRAACRVPRANATSLGPPFSGHASRGTRHASSNPRIAILRRLQELDYEAGSGIMIGIPGQTYEGLADDIEVFRTLDLDMIGVGPYLPHPATPLGQWAMAECGMRMADGPSGIRDPEPETGQVPNSEVMTYKAIALARIVCPLANIPSTTALATLNRASGRELGLARGANVVMPNLTPPAYRTLYEIYPSKACLFETAADCQSCLRQRILAMGRQIGVGRGDSRRKNHGALAARG